MGNDAIGVRIAGLRKEKGVTQEELAKNVCVSAQAVSKWENGGVPDIELLPKIADFFQVSIDTLFGRNTMDYNDIQDALIHKIIETQPDKRFEVVFELCWAMEQAMCGEMAVYESIEDYQDKLENNERRYSSILTDNGYTRMGIAKILNYFLIVPEVEDKERAFFDGIDYTALFKDLSNQVVFDTMVMLSKREHCKSFTNNWLTKNMGLDLDTTLMVIQTLQKYGIISIKEIEVDEVIQEVYTFNPTPSFTAMLIFAREIIDKPNGFSCFMGVRNKPYL